MAAPFCFELEVGLGAELALKFDGAELTIEFEVGFDVVLSPSVLFANVNELIGKPFCAHPCANANVSNRRFSMYVCHRHDNDCQYYSLRSGSLSIRTVNNTLKHGCRDVWKHGLGTIYARGECGSSSIRAQAIQRVTILAS